MFKNKKTFLGMPMNWDLKKFGKNLWNKDDPRIILPKSFGIGWTINFHALYKIPKRKNDKKEF